MDTHTHTHPHTHKERITHTQRKKERKWALQAPPPLLLLFLLLLFPSAHIHCDSSLCSRIAIRGTQTNFNFSHWAVCSHSSGVTPQTQRSRLQNVTVENVSTKKGHLEKSRRRRGGGGGGVGGWGGDLQETEWRKGKEATNSFVSRGFVCVPAAFMDADIKGMWACVCECGRSHSESELLLSRMKEVCLNESLVGSIGRFRSAAVM